MQFRIRLFFATCIKFVINLSAFNKPFLYSISSVFFDWKIKKLILKIGAKINYPKASIFPNPPLLLNQFFLSSSKIAQNYWKIFLWKYYSRIIIGFCTPKPHWLNHKKFCEELNSLISKFKKRLSLVWKWNLRGLSENGHINEKWSVKLLYGNII